MSRSNILLMLLLPLVLSIGSTAQAQLQSMDLPSIGTAAPVATQTPAPGRHPVPITGSFRIVNEFPHVIYFSIGDGRSFFPTALGPHQTGTFTHPGGTVFAAIETNGVYRTSVIAPGVVHRILVENGIYVIGP